MSDGQDLSCDVCIVGAGPVGLTAAMLLARAGRTVIVLEARALDAPVSAKSNHVSARTMEIFRQLGVADKVRAAGLPDDYPNDVVFATRLDGTEITRFRMPSRRERFRDRDAGYVDGDLSSAERPARLSQMYLEPILLDHAAGIEGITILGRTRYVDHAQDAAVVAVEAVALDEGERPVRIACRYMIGADGARSAVRKRIGATLHGLDKLVRAHSALIRAPGLIDRFGYQLGWMSWFPIGAAWAAVLAIDGRELWLFHWHYFPDDPAYDAFDLESRLREVVGGDTPLHYEIVAREEWQGKRLTANKVQEGRVFLCGDSAHQWVPFAGYGMNAGIADAHDLAWMLAGVLQGWAPASLPDAYAMERMPVTHQVAGFTARFVDVLRDIKVEQLDQDDAAGLDARRKVAEQIYAANIAAIVPRGLNFGYCYAESPIIAHDGAEPPPFSMGEYVPSLVPGCRLPHFELADGRALYDALGAGFTLLRLDAGIDVAPLVGVAAQAGLPMALLDITAADGADRSVYRMPLILVRPDQHIAWRGQGVPADPAALIDTIRGGFLA